MTTLDLPLLSVAKLRHGSKRVRDAELRNLKEAAQITGFGLLTDCDEDVPPLLVEDLYDKWKQVRALPKDLLDEITLDRHVDGSNRGFEGLGTQALDPKSPSGSGDHNISYRCTEDRNPSLDALIPTPAPKWAKLFNKENKWPNVKGFKESALMYLRGNWNTAETVFRGIEDEFKLPTTHIRSRRTERVDTLRLLYYPPTLPRKGQVACGEHTDFGTCTIVRRRGRGALEIQLLDGRWIEVRPPEGCAILNFADMLQWWTQEMIRSTPHRVIAGRGSQSLVTFCYADFWQELRDGITAGDYLYGKITESYRHSASALQETVSRSASIESMTPTKI
jgi:isopenicillin N synthase-like dioxygenase